MRRPFAEGTADRLWEAVADDLHAAVLAGVPGAFSAALAWTTPPRSALPPRPVVAPGQLSLTEVR